MTTPPDEPYSDPNRDAGDHEPTYNFGQQPEPTRPLGNELPPPPGYAAPGYGYGVDPISGRPMSDKSKLVAGLLQILLPIGIGRFYTGHTGIGVAQLLVVIFTCGLGTIWPFIDGIITLVSDSTDAQGRVLRS